MSSELNSLDCSDQKVVAALYETMGKALMAKAFSILGDRAQAGEVAQECFLKLWQKKSRFESPKLAYAWLYRVCHNHCIDLLRSGKARFEAPMLMTDEGAVVDFGGRSDTDAPAVSRDILSNLIEQLPERDSKIIALIYLDDMSQEEAADLIGVSRKTVQRSLEKSKQLLSNIANQ